MALRQSERGKRRGAAGGFSLPELLVSMAILSILMLALFVLFRSSLSSYKSTKRAMDASDEVRTAFSVLERDLAQTYSAKHYGDSATFFGTPFGFSMITTMDSGGQRTARVSYVVHRFAGQRDVRALVPYDPADPEDDREVRVPTFGIVRYIEPGVDSLSDYPIDWPDHTSAAVPPEETEQNLWQPLRDIYVYFGPDPNAGAGFDYTPVPPVKFDAMIEAKKHELWLAMLGDREEPFGLLPDLWAELGDEPEDYLIAEGVMATAGGPGPDMAQVQWFKYGFTDHEILTANWESMGIIQTIPYWHAVAEVNLGVPPDFDAGEPGDPNFPFNRLHGSPLYPFPPNLVAVNMAFAFPAPNLGERHLVRELSQTFQVPVGYRRPLLALD